MNILHLHPDDAIAIALEPLAPGKVIGNGIVVAEPVPAMHKVAIRPVAEGELITKGSHPIGAATSSIAAGEHVHSHNCATCHVEHRTAPQTKAAIPADVNPDMRATFDGFRRADGRVGTRNYVGVVTTVNCSATVARQIAAEAERQGLAEAYGQVDGIVAITHGTGCGMQSSGEGFETLRRTLDGFISHPNFGAVLVIGLGCEVMQAGSLTSGARIRKLSIQDAGGTRTSIDTGLELLRELLAAAGSDRREQIPASELTLALQCGGSDGWSGLTANPALGVAADILIQQGGRAILAETPEIYGAEHLLVARAAKWITHISR
jgi:altronate dehydratase